MKRREDDAREDDALPQRPGRERPEYRVEELAAEAGISVELLRSYQSKGLLPAPRHAGRVALYSEAHLERLRRILDLKAKGHSLRMIAHLLQQRPSSGNGDLVDTLAGTRGEEETLTLRQVADRTRVHPAVLRSFEASGVLRPRRFGDERRYTTADVRAVRMLLSLMGGGLPVEEFMRVARTQMEASEQVASEAARLFMRYVREPLLASGVPEEEEAERLVATFRMMLHATTTLMTYNFQRMVLNAVQDEIDTHGSHEERAALERVVVRRRLEVLPA